MTDADQAATPATSRRTSRREETRTRLLEAAARLLLEDGIGGLTSVSIARAAGVKTGTFYLHFADKAALFEEMLRATLVEWADESLQERDEASSAIDAISAVFKRSSEFSIGKAEFFALTAEHHLLAVSPSWGEVLARFQDHLDRLIRRGIDEGEIRSDVDAGTASKVVSELHISAVAMRRSALAVRPLGDTSTDKLIDFLRRALSARGVAAESSSPDELAASLAKVASTLGECTTIMSSAAKKLEQASEPYGEGSELDG